MLMRTIVRVDMSITIAMYTMVFRQFTWVKSVTNTCPGYYRMVVSSMFGYTTALFLGLWHFLPLRRYAFDTV